jgi:carbon-monoxide dehydrogenase small subunit
VKIAFELNGAPVEIDSEPMARLLDVLRRDLLLTGSKEGCGEGECGACTVLIDGRPVNACLVPVGQVNKRRVRTIEGVGSEAMLTAVQQALIDHGGTQCGICTPGFVMCATAVLIREPDASRERIRELLAGNLCRCTGYQRIVDAVAAAAERERAQ